MRADEIVAGRTYLGANDLKHRVSDIIDLPNGGKRVFYQSHQSVTIGKREAGSGWSEQPFTSLQTFAAMVVQEV